MFFLFIEDGYTLKMLEQQFTGSDTERATVFQLIDPLGEVYSIPLSTIWDKNLRLGMPICSPKPIDNTEYNTAITFAPETKIVTFSTDKITYTLDFTTGLYTDERSYPPHIIEDPPLTVSPSGNIQLLSADSSERFWF